MSFRQLTAHKVNGLNELLKVYTLDEPGPGGAHHEYSIAWEADVPPLGQYIDDVFIHFQRGPVNEVGVNGVSIEALLAIVADRLNCFQAGEYACEENAIALEHVSMAMNVLHQRTLKRIARGVEGTATV